MRTRNQSRNDKEDPTSDLAKSKTLDEEGSLAKISKAGVGKFLNKANSRSGKKQSLSSDDKNNKSKKDTGECQKELVKDFNLKGCTSIMGKENTLNRQSDVENGYNNAYEMDWEEGDVCMSENVEGYSHETGRTINIEFTDSPSTIQKKRARKVTAEDKESAELVHKAHLLCLLGRGRLVDIACNDTLIQASILSLLPSYLLKIMNITDLKAHILGPLVRWFRDNFNVKSEGFNETSFNTNLAYALEAREGSAEEIAALSVALFRALNLKARYVSILDVASLKPDTDMATSSPNVAPRFDTKINSATYNKVVRPLSPDVVKEQNISQSQKGKVPDNDNSSTCEKNLSIDDSNANISKNETKDSLPSKRKGDLEFELQLEMALSTSRIATNDDKSDTQPSPSSSALALKKSKRTNLHDSTTNSSAVWSRKAGPPLYWAEVYCSLETLNGRWVHIDAVNGIIDGEGKVEAAAAASRRPLKYVVAFAGNGAKDVTRRYCTQWYKIEPRRINSEWWDEVLAPLKELELNAFIGMVQVENSQENASTGLDKKRSEMAHVPISVNSIKSASNQEHSCKDTLAAGPSGFSLEDAELETRALTEPLPTNQLAYKNHHLYAIEKWLNKHQILHPKGPVLGYCSGHSVYPRSCVQNLQTKQRWFREGLQVKANELPAKIVKRSKKSGKAQKIEHNISEEDDGGSETNLELYGKWQLEPLQLPHAVNGIVPKNEWGRVDAWSEKCLPHGTVHLRLPRLVPVAKRLGIDFAHAMVGFEFKSGSSHPVYEGIVVCKEFKDAILEAYNEEEERRECEERKKNEMQAIIRWRQLLSSIATRQRLQNSYVNASSSHIPPNTTLEDQNNKDVCSPSRDIEGEDKLKGKMKKSSKYKLDFSNEDDHVHEYPIEKQSFDEDSMIRTKRCLCGFSIEVEEL